MATSARSRTRRHAPREDDERASRRAVCGELVRRRTQPPRHRRRRRGDRASTPPSSKVGSGQVPPCGIRRQHPRWTRRLPARWAGMATPPRASRRSASLRTREAGRSMVVPSAGNASRTEVRAPPRTRLKDAAATTRLCRFPILVPPYTRRVSKARRAFGIDRLAEADPPPPKTRIPIDVPSATIGSPKVVAPHLISTDAVHAVSGSGTLDRRPHRPGNCRYVVAERRYPRADACGMW